MLVFQHTNIFQFGCCLNPKGFLFFWHPKHHPFSTPKGRSRYLKNICHRNIKSKILACLFSISFPKRLLFFLLPDFFPFLNNWGPKVQRIFGPKMNHGKSKDIHMRLLRRPYWLKLSTCQVVPSQERKILGFFDVSGRVLTITPPKFNMEPENDGFQEELPFLGTSF